MIRKTSLYTIVCCIFLAGCTGTTPQEAQKTAEARAYRLLLTPTPTPTITPSPTIPPTATPLPDKFTDAKGAAMQAIPAGKFIMGTKDYGEDHQVTLDAYYIDKYEVTNAAYKLCVDAGSCLPPISNFKMYYEKPEYADYPVTYVDWNMAKTYCEWRGARLPTEAEWEKAARGTDGRIYPWGENIGCDKANYGNELCVGDLSKVGSYESGKSPYGIYDMTGNALEWVNDWYDESYYENSPFHNPLGPDHGQHRSVRGGSWVYSDTLVTSSIRYEEDPTYNNDDLGFRCAFSPAHGQQPVDKTNLAITVTQTLENNSNSSSSPNTPQSPGTTMPILGDIEETQKALDENVETLRKAADEQYSSEFMVGETRNYTVHVINADRPLRWYQGWCAKSDNTLAQNLKNMKFELNINGQAIDLDKKAAANYFEDSDGFSCLSYSIVMYGWPSGSTSLISKLIFLDTINDGESDYDAGEMTQIFTVINP
jgi:formylglycine-generating enzyme required for sulfatase activity